MENKFKNKNKIIYILLVCIFLVVGFLLYENYSHVLKSSKNASNQGVGKEDGLVAFNFLPEKNAVTLDKDFTIEIAIDPKKHLVSNADLIFSYNKSVMRLDSISQSEKFMQVLVSKISDDGVVSYSAATNFGSNIDARTTYAVLHFHALKKIENSPITVDQKKSGIYADDNPGVNILGYSDLALVSITE
ncbi:MAG: hypothetical protein HGA36_02165 [Candidatus Moranbacteria bacterium]|nr:hypothetical protein [Candidatus Moranbacteria bacterium]